MNLSAKVKTIARCAAAFVAVIPCAYGRDCSTSNKLRLNKPQVLSGVLEDERGRGVPSVTIELLSNKISFRRRVSDDQGKYDFGDVPAGEYRVRVQHGDHDFCAAKVRCGREGCAIEPRLNGNPEKMIMVE